MGGDPDLDPGIDMVTGYGTAGKCIGVDVPEWVCCEWERCGNVEEEFRGGERPWMGVMPNATRRECVRWCGPALSCVWWLFAGGRAVSDFNVAFGAQCDGDGALELGVLGVPATPVIPRWGWWELTGLLSLLDGMGGILLSAAWCGMADRALLDPERVKEDTVEGEDPSTVIGLAMAVEDPDPGPSAE
jgi:hypothetical protein